MIDLGEFEGTCPVAWTEDGARLRLLDQRRLPEGEHWLELATIEEVAVAIEDLVVRGAPAIGCAAAMGLAACAERFSDDRAQFQAEFDGALDRLSKTRPTAVNLFVALDQMREVVAARSKDGVGELRRRLSEAAAKHVRDDLRMCLEIGRHGGPLMPDTGGVLTHCNAGGLATAGYGTALGVIRRGRELGKEFMVFADETRPVLQGARLTSWELLRDGVPVTVIADNMAGALMAAGRIQAAVVGADRIARNGDVANKIGTYTVAILCRYHDIPFYVAAPWTTIDLDLADGTQIPIEQRDGDEVRRHGGALMTPPEIPVENPAFDVTPANLVKAIITDRGVFAPAQLANARPGLDTDSAGDR